MTAETREKHNEVFEHFFTTDELIALKKEVSKNEGLAQKYEQLNGKIHVLSETHDKISYLKNKVIGSLEDRVDTLLGVVSTVDDDGGLQGKIDKASIAVKTKVKQKLVDLKKKSPKIWGLFKAGMIYESKNKESSDKEDSFFGFGSILKPLSDIKGFIGATIISTFGGFFGITDEMKRAYGIANGLLEDEPDVSGQDSKLQNEGGGDDQKPAEGPDDQQQDEGDLPEAGSAGERVSDQKEIFSKKTLYSKIGFEIMKTFSGKRPSDETNFILEKLKVKKSGKSRTLGEVQILLAGSRKNGEKDDGEVSKLAGTIGIDEKYSGDNIYDVLSMLANDYASIMWEERLHVSKVRHLVLDASNNEKRGIQGILSPDAIQMIKSGSLNYLDLSIQDATVLMTLSFMGVFQTGAEKVQGLGIDLFNMLQQESDILTELEEELVERKENLLSPKNLTLIYGVEGDLLHGGGNARVGITLEDIQREYREKNSGKDAPSQSKEQITKFLAFRTTVINFIEGNEIVHLGVDKFEEYFSGPQGVNLADIYFLYSILDGRFDTEAFLRSFEEANNKNEKNEVQEMGFEKVILGGWIARVLDRPGGDGIDGAYEVALATRAMSMSGDSFFTENEKKLANSLLTQVSTSIWNETLDGVGDFTEGYQHMIKELLSSAGISDSTTNQLIALIAQGGVVAFVGWVMRKFFLGRVLLATGVLAPIMGFVIQHYGLEWLKTNLDEGMYNELDSLVFPGRVSIGAGKFQRVPSMEDAEKAINDPKAYKIEILDDDRIKKGSIEIACNRTTGVRVTSGGETYQLDIGPEMFDYDERDEYKGIEYLMTVAHFDDEKENILVGTGADILSIPVLKVFNAVEGGRRTKQNNIDYIVIEENTNNSNGLINGLPDGNGAKLFFQENIVLKKI